MIGERSAGLGYFAAGLAVGAALALLLSERPGEGARGWIREHLVDGLPHNAHRALRRHGFRRK